MPLFLRHRFSSARRALVGTLLSGAALAVSATPLTYDVSATFTSGPFTGTAVSGHFSFDSSLATPLAIQIGSGLVTELSFSFEGVDYDASDAPLAGLVFNSAGVLSQFLFGSHCALTNTLSCSVGTLLPGSWFVQHSVIGYAGLGAQPDDPSISFATNPAWTLRRQSVPEPGSLALGLLALAACRPRRSLLPALTGRGNSPMP
jgi:hypothetical protein